MWFVYGFTPSDVQVGSGREFEQSVAAFCMEVRAHFGADAFSVTASARPKGSIEVWYRLPRRPDGDAFWRERLQARGLSARRVPARA